MSATPRNTNLPAAALQRIDIDSFTALDFHRSYKSRGIPVIIDGLLKDVPEWTLDYLRGKLGGQSFTARHYGPDRFTKPKTEWKGYCELKTLDFNDYATLLEDGTARKESIYLAQVDIGTTRIAESIQTAFDKLAANTGMEGATGINLWLGPAGHTEPLHFDTADGTLVQLHGTKHIALFPPAQSKNLYPFEFFGGGLPPWFSQVYVNKPDLNAYPRMNSALATQIDVQLNAGELLYIPANWWHEVTAITSDAAGTDYVCSLNRFWKVRPIQRVFQSPRSAAIYGLSTVMAKGLAKPILNLHKAIVKMGAAKSEAAAKQA